MRRVCCIKMATMKTQEKKCKSIKHVPIPRKESTLKVGGAAYTQVLTVGWNTGYPIFFWASKKSKNHTSGSFYQI
ncbi:hypothetical protein ACROYT_G001604 [Oculina patagonica]